MFYTPEEISAQLQPLINTSQLLQAYSLLQNNNTYKAKFSFYRNIILQQNYPHIYTLVRVIKNILTYSTLRSLKDISMLEKGSRFGNVDAVHRQMKFDEFSKLLALRFLRQTYFYSNYLYMTLVHIQLSPILQKLGCFNAWSSDEQRGRNIFLQKKKGIFIRLHKIDTPLLQRRQLQTIGYSLHKLTLQILQMNAQTCKYLPYHQQNIAQLNTPPPSIQNHSTMNSNLPYKLAQCFYNDLYKVYLKMKQENVSFPQKFSYFKPDQQHKILAHYKSFYRIELINDFYAYQFSVIWQYVNSEAYLYNYSGQNVDSAVMGQKYVQVARAIMWVKCIAMKTNDRYLYDKLHEMITSKLQVIMLESNKIQNNILLKQAININAFLALIIVNMPSLQILHQLEHHYVVYLAKAYNSILDMFGEVNQRIYLQESVYHQQRQLQNWGDYKQYITVTLFTISRVALVFKIMTKQMISHFNNQQHFQNVYPNLFRYTQMVSAIQPKNNIQCQLNPLTKNIITLISNNLHHSLSSKMHQELFMFYYYNKNINNNTFKTRKAVQKQIRQTHELIGKYKYYVEIITYKEAVFQVEYVNLEPQIISEDQVSVSASKSKRSLMVSRLSKSKYSHSEVSHSAQSKGMQLNLQSNIKLKREMNNSVKQDQFRFAVKDRSSSPIYQQEAASPLLSIKVNSSLMGTPVSQKSINSVNISPNSVYRVNYTPKMKLQEPNQQSQANSKIQISQAADFKSSLRLRMSPAQQRNLKSFGPLSRSKKRRHSGVKTSLINHMRQLSPKVIHSRQEQSINTSIHNIHNKTKLQKTLFKDIIHNYSTLQLHQDNHQTQLNPSNRVTKNNANRIQKLKKLKQTTSKNDKGVQFMSNFSLLSIGDSEMANVISQKIIKINEGKIDFDGGQNREEQSKMIVLEQLQLKSVIHSKQQPLQSHILSNASIQSLNFFIFPHKIKKDLVKHKVLIHKNKHLEVGMMCDLHQEVIQYNKRSVKFYRLNAMFYTTIFVSLQEIHLNVQTPNWLKSTHKTNIKKENVKEQSQITSSFKFELESKKKDRNFGQLPILNVVYYDEQKGKHVVSQSLPILINKFTIQQKFSEAEYFQLVNNGGQISQVYELMVGMDRNLTSLKGTYTQISYFIMDIPEQMALFSKLDHSAIDHIAIAKFHYIPNSQQFILIFFQGEQKVQLSGQSKVKLDANMKKMHFGIFFLKDNGWNIQDKNIVNMVYRSILSQ